jgi:hypothetical protein
VATPVVNTIGEVQENHVQKPKCQKIAVINTRFKYSPITAEVDHGVGGVALRGAKLHHLPVVHPTVGLWLSCN